MPQRFAHVLTGDDRGAHRDCLLLGAALALEVAGLAKSPREGAERASAGYRHAVSGAIAGQARRVW